MTTKIDWQVEWLDHHSNWDGKIHIRILLAPPSLSKFKIRRDNKINATPVSFHCHWRQKKPYDGDTASWLVHNYATVETAIKHWIRSSPFQNWPTAESQHSQLQRGHHDRELSAKSQQRSQTFTMAESKCGGHHNFIPAGCWLCKQQFICAGNKSNAIYTTIVTCNNQSSREKGCHEHLVIHPVVPYQALSRPKAVPS